MIFQHELIKSLRKNIKNTAIERGEEQISYSRLLNRANKITAHLLKENPEKETMIGILLQDRYDFICSIIGAMNARHVFVPLDGALPEKRLSTVLRDLNLQYVISSKDSPGVTLVAGLPFTKLFYIEEIAEDQGEERDYALQDAVTYPEYEMNDSLYIYFTSGSTGNPKGIVGKNCSLLQFLRWEINAFHIDEQSRVSQMISPYFDACLRDIFVPLLTGGTLCVPVDKEELLIPEKLVSWIDQHRISLIHCVPSLFRIMNNNELLSPALFKNLRHILFSGEKIVPAELAGWYDIFGIRIQLVNLYGATETTMIRSFYKISPEDTGLVRIPIGSPIDDTQLLVAREDLTPCSPLVTGELYIISDYISKGYLNAPELTHEKFLKFQPGANAPATAFKTGDKARVLPGGKIDLIGRTDRQIKLRGIRVELDEIEQVFLQAAFIKNAVVTQRTGEHDAESLIAFVIRNKDTREDFDIAGAARGHLNSSLPEYMIPSDIIEVREFPLLSNGKIDHKKLFDGLTKQSIIAPANALEEKILSIWKEILGDKPVSTEDNFHSIGGNSISIMKLIGKLYKEFNVRVTLGEIFNNLTVRQQAKLIGQSMKDDLLVIPKTSKKSGYRLSAAQERIYYAYTLNKDSTAYNLPMAWKITGPGHKRRIQETLRALIHRHESLRTEIKFVEGKLLQIVRDSVDFDLEEIQCGHHGVEEAIRAFIRPFDPGKAPLIRAGIISGTNKEEMLIIDLHHIVCDGMSQQYLMSDFLKLYQGRPLAPLALQYKDYTEWEYTYKKTEEYVRHREFWLKQFEGPIPGLALPTVQAPDENISDEGETMRFEIKKRLVSPLMEALKKEDITTFSGWYTLFYLFLAQLTGQNDIVIGINTTGRSQEELEGVVGMFAKTLPIRCPLPEKTSFRDLAKMVHKSLLQAVSRQIYDLSDIQRELNHYRDVPIKNLFQVMFVYLDFDNNKQEMADTVFKAHPLKIKTSKYPITLFAAEDAETFSFRLEYSSACFTVSDADILVTQFTSLVAGVTNDIDQQFFKYQDKDMPSFSLEEDTISFNL